MSFSSFTAPMSKQRCTGNDVDVSDIVISNVREDKAWQRICVRGYNDVGDVVSQALLLIFFASVTKNFCGILLW